MTTNHLRELHHHGQSVWLDQLRRDWLASGELATWMTGDGLGGVTSNPTIFEQAIAGTDVYDARLSTLARQGLETRDIYDVLTLEDIRAACDVFRPVYDASGGHDGYVSHEVSPALAHDARGTVADARRLWAAIGRPNAMIKIPVTPAGTEAGEVCLSDGINVNFTLIFAQTHYDAAVEAYLRALESRVGSGKPLEHVASVASFFVSRVDTLVDGLLDARLAREGETPDALVMSALRGTAAVANAKLAYRRYQEHFRSARFAKLERHGARTQRVLWASTGTKDPAYSDVKYVDELIGAHTVTTLPLSTMAAFRDHGRPATTLTADVGAAEDVVRDLKLIGIDLERIGATLSDRGIAAFAASFEALLAAIEARRGSYATP